MRKKGLAIAMAVTLGLSAAAPTFAVNATELPQDNVGVVQETTEDTEQEDTQGSTETTESEEAGEDVRYACI